MHQAYGPYRSTESSAVTTPLSLSIGALAAQAGVSVETVRFYQRTGLLALPARPPKGIRRYAPEAVSRIQFIKAAQRWGFSLTDVAELLLLEDGTACGRVRAIAEARLAVIRDRLKELRRVEDALRAALTACRNTGRARLSCPLITSILGRAIGGPPTATRPRTSAKTLRPRSGARS